MNYNNGRNKVKGRFENKIKITKYKSKKTKMEQ